MSKKKPTKKTVLTDKQKIMVLEQMISDLTKRVEAQEARDRIAEQFERAERDARQHRYDVSPVVPMANPPIHRPLPPPYDRYQVLWCHHPRIPGGTWR